VSLDVWTESSITKPTYSKGFRGYFLTYGVVDVIARLCLRGMVSATGFDSVSDAEEEGESVVREIVNGEALSRESGYLFKDEMAARP